MPSPLKKGLPWLALVSLVAGVVLGGMLGIAEPQNPLAPAVEQALELIGSVVLAWLRALAIPLIFSSIVLGGVGLEAMRTMGRLVGKTMAWIIGTSLLAVATAVGIAKCTGSVPGVASAYFLHPSAGANPPETMTRAWGWTALVFLSLGFGYYRNQLDEGHGKLFMRFCQGLEGMLKPLLRSVQMVGTFAIFALATTSTTRHIPFWRIYLGDAPGVTVYLQEHGFPLLLETGVAFLVILSLVVWVKARIGPWKYFPALVPAMLLAAAGQSVEASLPLTMETMRGRIGISNRVASAVLPLCAALHRDGVALLWAVVMIVISLPGGMLTDWLPLTATGMMALTLGCGGHALAGQGGLVAASFADVNRWGDNATFPLMLGWVITSFGSAISVFSHACATIIISRSEGEFWVPGAPPAPDELQGLKTDLELADS